MSFNIKIFTNFCYISSTLRLQKYQKMCFLGFISEFINKICLLILTFYKILYVFEVMFIQLGLRVNKPARIQQQTFCIYTVKYMNTNGGFRRVICFLELEGWIRAQNFYINNYPTRHNTKQSIYYSASSLYLFRVSTTPFIRSTQNCNCISRYWSYFLCSSL